MLQSLFNWVEILMNFVHHIILPFNILLDKMRQDYFCYPNNATESQFTINKIHK